jgi:hypothetical protein
MDGGYPAAKRSSQGEVQAFAERERLYERGLDRGQMNSLMQRLQDKLGSKNKLAEAVYGRRNAASAIKQVMEGGARYTDAVIDQTLRLAAIHGVGKYADPGRHDDAANEDASDAPLVASDDGPGQAAVDPNPSEQGPAEAGLPEPGLRDEPPEGAEDQRTEDAPTIAEASAPEAPEPVTEVSGDEGRKDDAVEPADSGPAPGDWLSGVRERRAEYESELEDSRQEDVRLQAEMARIQQETARLREETERLRQETERNEAEIGRVQQETQRISERRSEMERGIGEIDQALTILQAI